MRGLLILLPAALMAQTTPPPKSPAPAPKAATAPAKSAAPGTAPAKTGPPIAAKKAVATPAGTMTTDDQKTIYAIGVALYRSVARFDLTPAEFELVKKGMADAAAGKPAVDPDTWSPKIESLTRARAVHIAEKEKAASKSFLVQCATEPGAVKLPSGLVYRDIKVGTGPSPKATDTVTAHYRGTLINGTEFDSSYKRGQPTPFGLNQVIPCWTEGVQRMKVGGKARLVCPSEIAYGDQGRPGIPGGATLIFEIELVSIGGGH